MTASEQPLNGVTVVALEHAVAAPFATRQLADLGARVIKVERPGTGDFARHYDRSVHGESSYFVWLNRGKESIELDLKAEADRSLLDRILERADVLLHNLGPGATERLGLDADSLRERFPALIHVSISGYGIDGPYAHKKAYDLLVQCETGVLDVTGTPAEAAKVGVSIADIATGMYAYTGVLTALYERRRTGCGSTLEVAMLDALGEWMQQPVHYSIYGDVPVQRSGAHHASIAPYGPYSTGDGETVFLAVQNEREWVALCIEVLARPDLVNDLKFARNVDRVRNRDELSLILQSALSRSSAAALVDLFDRIGIACAHQRTPAGFAAHPQLAARHRWRVVAAPGGEFEALVPPVTVRGCEPAMGPVPRLGQHNDQIRQEFAVLDES